MNKEHLKGEAKKAEGQAKETAGKVSDDEKLKAEGKIDQLEGKGRKAVGDAKDAAK